MLENPSRFMILAMYTETERFFQLISFDYIHLSCRRGVALPHFWRRTPRYLAKQRKLCRFNVPRRIPSLGRGPAARAGGDIAGDGG